ncbi:MAG: fimbria major subunit [Rikenellaceae bacterium]|nr:fimbria major subunit [Rikenellaceae bacterium]MCL2693045.1 fimbria major subunit [Rikenellaceae bacterium]
MKKFLFSAVAMAMAFGMLSCTQEREAGENGKGNETTGSTAVSFSFNLPSATRAPIDFEPDGQAENNAQEVMFGAGDLTILIFNNAGILEKKAEITSSTYTTLLSAGQKTIFVLANLGTAANHALPNLKKVNTATLVPSVDQFTLADLVEGSTTFTLTNFLAVAFDAGTPQAYDVNKAGARTFSVVPLHTLVAAGTRGLPMSNSNASVFTVNANVTEDQANTPGTPVLSGSEQYNRFKIELDFLGAKARVIMNPATLPQTIADISQPTYSVKNLAKYTSLVQRVVSGNPRSIYHTMTFTPAGDPVAYTPHFDQASSITQPVLANPATTPTYIYVPENTNTVLLRGQSSFYAMNVTYKPRNIVSAIAYNTLITEPPRIDFTRGAYDAVVITPANSYVYVTEDAGIHGITDRFFRTARLLADAVWMAANDLPITHGSYSASAADALVAGKYKTFVDAQSWYRFDIGVGAAPNTVFGVLRGNAYTATVTNLTGPGEPTEGDLFEEPEIPVETRTYINVEITAKGWAVREQIVEG